MDIELPFPEVQDIKDIELDKAFELELMSIEL